jgi:hypothetical protein
MFIRAIDYTPPLDFAFEDFLDAVLASDQEVAPDDQHGYRDFLIATFAEYDIAAPARVDRDVLAPGQGLDYASLHLDELKADPTEVFRFIWQNAAPLELETDFYLSVETVEPARRVGPDGFVIYESAASYVQMVDSTVAGLAALARSQGSELLIPTGMDTGERLQVIGGGALIFDEFGRAKYHQRKPLFDWVRQSKRLAYLVDHDIRDRRGRFGFSDGMPLGERFRLLHEPVDVAGEQW